MAKLFIPVILGTSRQDSNSSKIAKIIAEIGSQFENIEIIIVNPKDLNFPGDGRTPECKDPKYSEITKRADAFYIVTPEYNFSIPGSLKRMLDSELENYTGKPVTFAGVSSGPIGGARATEILSLVSRRLGMFSALKDVYFPNVQDLLNERGELQNEKYKEYIKTSWVELIWMTETLKYGRDNIVKTTIS